MVDFIRGPMIWIAFGVFILGLMAQGIRFILLTRKKAPSFLPPTQANTIKGKKRGNRLQMLSAAADNRLTKLRASVLGVHPLMTTVTVVFHVCLFVVPIFLLAHNIMLEDSLGFGLPSLPDGVADTLTILFLGCGVFFLFRRLFVRRVRAITSPGDIMVFLVTMAPFVTGFFAYHHWFDYKIVLQAHVILGELMLMVIPFTKLGHMIFFFFYRFWLGGEYGFGQAKRTW